MCLETIEPKLFTSNRGFGWKYFCDIHKDSVFTGYCNYELRRGKWNRDVNAGVLSITYNHQVRYPAGFHVYLEKPMTYNSHDLRRVAFRGRLAVGRQESDRIPTIVAREIYVPKVGERLTAKIFKKL